MKTYKSHSEIIWPLIINNGRTSKMWPKFISHIGRIGCFVLLESLILLDFQNLLFFYFKYEKPVSNIWFSKIIQWQENHVLQQRHNQAQLCGLLWISGQIWIWVWMTNLNSKPRMASTGQLWRKQLENPFPASDPIRKTESQNVSWGCWLAENSWKGLRTHYSWNV